MKRFFEFLSFFIIFFDVTNPGLGLKVENKLNNGKRPNIVLILTDDQDVELGSMHYMRRTLKRVRDEGAEMKRAYATTAICCPSRSSLLTGRYIHNHNVRSNGVNCTGPQWRQDEEPRSFGVYLSDSGYGTGYFGKYLNRYDGSYVPPGWQEWISQVNKSVYYNYTMNKNGKLVNHGDNYAKDYFPDILTKESVAFLRKSSQHPDKPFFLFVSFNAPHSPNDAAPQFSHLFFGATRHHNPSYNYAPNPDKQPVLRSIPKMNDLQMKFTDLLMTKRLQTLQTVDLAVEKIYRTLKEIGELENTYLIYTSDHGFHIGHFGLIQGKGFHFETDVRVPFFIRGPGIKPGTVFEEIILNIDLAPTFLDIAGLEIPDRMDGRSFKEFLVGEEKDQKQKSSWPDTFIIESPVLDKRDQKFFRKTLLTNGTKQNFCEDGLNCLRLDKNYWKTPPVWGFMTVDSVINADNNIYNCIRTINSTDDLLYCRFSTGEKLFHDMKKDPYQLVNSVSSLTPMEHLYFEDKINRLTNCKGAENCNVKNL